MLDKVPLEQAVQHFRTARPGVERLVGNVKKFGQQRSNLPWPNLVVSYQKMLYRFGLFTRFLNAIRQLLLAQYPVCDQAVVFSGFFSLDVT